MKTMHLKFTLLPAPYICNITMIINQITYKIICKFSVLWQYVVYP